jgi:hypothetical protein
VSSAKWGIRTSTPGNFHIRSREILNIVVF